MAQKGSVDDFAADLAALDSIKASDDFAADLAALDTVEKPKTTRHPVVQAQGFTDPLSVKVTEPQTFFQKLNQTLSFADAGGKSGTQQGSGAPMGSIPVLDSPVVGAKQAGPGIATLSSATGRAMAGLPAAHTKKELLTAGADVIEGAFKMAEPLMAGAFLVNPVGVLWAGLKAQIAATAGEEAAGLLDASPEAQRLVGDVAALASAGVDVRAAVRSSDRQFEDIGRRAGEMIQKLREGKPYIDTTGGVVPEAPAAGPGAPPAPTAPRGPRKPVSPGPQPAGAIEAQRAPVEQVWADFERATEAGDTAAQATSRSELRRRGVTQAEVNERLKSVEEKQKLGPPLQRLDTLEKSESGESLKVPFAVQTGETPSQYYRSSTGEAQVVDVPLAQIVSTQATVDPNIVRNYVKGDLSRTEPPDAVEFEGRYYLADGTHRAVAAWANGADTIQLRVKQVDPEKLSQLQRPVEPTGLVKEPPPAGPDDAAQFVADLAAIKADEPRKYSSTQVNLPTETAERVRQMAASIAEGDLVGKGRETAPHVTVKYGIHGNDVEPLRKVLEAEKPVTVTLGKASLFPDSGNGEVVKLDVDSPDLHRLNKVIADAVETTSAHPDYTPHVTLAYVKPGTGAKYEGRDDLAGQSVTIDKIVFSTADDQEVEIKLKGAPDAVQEPSAAAVDAQPKTGDGKAVGKGDAEGTAPAGKGVKAKREKPTAKVAPTPEPASEPKLPAELAGAKPMFNVGRTPYRPRFDSDIDKAAFILAQAVPSKANAKYMRFVMEQTGLSEDGVLQLATKVKAAVKEHVTGQPSGDITIPKIWKGVESAHAGDDDAGQLPVAGGAAADTDRDRGGEPLPAVPAGDGEVAGDEEGRPGAGDAAPVVESGAGSAAADDEVTGSVAAASGGDHPAPVAVSPTGAEHDPGAIPLDYALTPERIEAIVSRGAAQRAKDNLAAILTVKALQEEKRWPTADEQETLSKYVGWGDSDVAQYLAPSPRYNWSKPEKTLWEELKGLPEDDLKALRSSSTNAHFTFDLYKPIWEALTAAGFGGGRVLEPASGVGHAIGLMPPTTLANSTVTAVELEPLTAAIAGFLYPTATVQATGFEKALIARGTIDLAISNVPFAKGGVYDPTIDPSVTKPIHNYFFAKTLEYLRPGGLLVFITSRFTLDGPTHTAFRQYLADRADFLGAVRLPSEAFDKTAKTEVVTDIIVMRKREEGTPEAETNKLFITVDEPSKLQPGSDYRGRPTGGTVFRSQWYTEHPELVLGKEDKSGTMYGRSGYNVSLEKPETLPAKIAEALATVLPKGSYQRATRAVKEKKVVDRATAKVGELRVGDDKKSIVVVGADGTLEDATPKRRGAVDTAAIARLKGMIGIRDARRAAVRIMRDETSSDADVAKAQKALGKAYDAFVAEHGHLNARTNKMLFAGDPEAAAILALEVVETKAVNGTDKQGRPTLNVSSVVSGKADIFTKRTMRPVERVTSVSAPKDALLASLGTHAGIDWPYMEAISGEKTKDLQAALVDEGLVYEQPNGSYVLAEEYLSGDVVTKLEDAKAAGKKFARNVAALEPLQPTPKTKEDIESGVVSVALGAGWVEPEVFADFVKSQLNGQDVTLRRTTTTALVKWTIDGSSGADAAAIRHPLAVEYSHGKRYSFLDLVLDTLNLQAPTLGEYVEVAPKSKKFIRDDKATLAARANQDSVRDLWLQYLFERPELQDRLLDIFNTRFNRTIERTYDGARLTFEGMTDTVKLLPHQRNAVWRILTTGNTLLAHEVGAGKTFEMIAASMEMKRTGRASKPAIVVPTYLIGQWRKDIMRLYPDAKLLAFEENDLDADKRQLAMARIANGTWDIVLIPHSSFGLLSVDPSRMQAMYDRWIAELEAAIEGADQMSVKALERVKNGLKDKVTKLREKIDARSKDNALTWEELGIDALFIDEAHAFKNLFYFSEIENIRGLSKSSSDRSIDLFIKVQEINEQSRYRNLVLATATPMMNSMAEVYTMQRYLQPQVLQQHGLSQFDLWYAMFAKALPSTEQQPDGTYKEVMRLRDFRNLQLLSKMVRQVMDYVGWEDMPYLQLPAVEGGKVEIVQTESHPMYGQAQKWFSERMANLRDLPPKIDRRKNEYVAPMRFHPITGEPMDRPDNILTVMTDAKKAAVDLRLVFGEYAKDWKGSRVQALADRVAKIYKAGHKGKLTQLVFLDLGTPKDLQPLEFLKDTVVSGDEEPEETTDEESEDLAPVLDDEEEGDFNLYGAVKRELERRGIPSAEIAFIHQAETNAERTALFDAMNEGKVRVMLASTDKGGVGMNVQKRLVAIHEMDAPRAGRPGDLRQRMGRGIRQGNTNKAVRLIRYVTKGTTDEWLWGVMVNKDAQIQQFMRGKATHLLEEDPSTMSLQEAQIRSSGDPRGIELVELKAKNARLAAQAANAQNAVALAKSDIVRMGERIRHFTRDLNDLTAWVSKAWKSQRGEAFSMKVGRDTFTKREDANTALLAAVRRLFESDEMIDRAVGEIGGLPIVAHMKRYVSAGKGKMERVVVAELRLNEGVFGGSPDLASTIEWKETQPISEAGQGVNAVAALVNAFERIPDRKRMFEVEIERANDRKTASEKTVAVPSPAIQEHARVVARIGELEKELKLEGEGEQELDEQGKPKVKPKRMVPEFRKPVKAKGTKKAVSLPARSDLTRIYRAHDKDFLDEIHAWSSWSPEEETARAYTDNPGFGGPRVRFLDVELKNVLDVNTHSERGFIELAKELGFSRDYGERWWGNNWRYPWEHSEEIREALQESEFDWLRYEDDFPEGATTLVAIRDVELPEEGKEMAMPSATGPLPKRPKPATARKALPVDLIVKKLSMLFDKVPVSVGHFRARFARAIYKPQQEAIRALQANDLYAVAHEFGHHLDMALMRGSAVHKRGAIAAELKKLGAATSMPSYTAQQQRWEGAAEFFRIWLLEPERLVKEAPLYLKEFERFLAKEPKIAAGLEDIRDDVQMYLSLPGVEQAKLSIDFGENASIIARAQRLYEQATSDEERRDALTYLSAQFVDDLAWLARAEKEMADGIPVDIVRSAHAISRLARGSAAKAEGFLRFGVRNRDGQIVSGSFDAAIKPVMGDLVAFQTYLKARHAQDIEAAGKVSGLSAGQIAEALALETPEFKDAAGKLDEFQRAMRRYMVSAGIWSMEQVRAMERAWPHYVPMSRVMDDEGGGVESQARRMANRPKGPKGFKGSGRRTYPALENIIRNVHEMVNNAEYNKAMLALVEQVTGTQGSGRLMEEIPALQVATRVNLAAFEEEIREKLKAQGFVLPEGIDFDELLTIWTPRQYATKDGRFVTVADRGKLRWFEVHEPGLYDAITAIGAQGTKDAIGFFKLGTQTVRKFATTTIGFALARNPPRDIMTAWTYSRTGWKPTDFLKGLFSVLAKDEDYQLFVHSGAGRSAMVARDRNLVKRHIDDLGKTKRQQLLAHTILGPLDGLQALSQALEEATRVGEFKRTLKLLGRDEGGIMQGGLNAMDVTQDFTKMGAWVRQYNDYVAFFGAKVGSYTRLAQAMKEGGGGGKIPPKKPGGKPTGGAEGGFGGASTDTPGFRRFMWKAMTTISLFSLLLWIMHYDDEEYQQRPDWEKAQYWHFGRNGHYILISKPFELGTLFGTTVEDAMDWLYGRDKSVLDKLPSQSVANDLAMHIIPAMALPIAEVASNYSFFKGRAIVNPFDTDLEPYLQYNRWTSETAKELGKALNLSPAKIEHLFLGYTAGVGRGALQATDAAIGLFKDGPSKPSGGVQQWPVVGSFYRGKAMTDAQSLSDFFDARNRLVGLEQSVKRLTTQGRRAEAESLKADNRELFERAKIIKAADAKIRKARNVMNQVFDHADMTPAEKDERLANLSKQMIQIAQTATR